jgi:hypothetical protein
MFRYQPPKSSTWGHRLQKLTAARARELFGQFLATAVAEYQFKGGSLIIGEPSGQVLQRYEVLAGAKALNGYLGDLACDQTEKCIDEFIKDEASASFAPDHFVLAQHFEITKWLVQGQEAATRSTLFIYYGLFPCLSTLLQFETVQQFQAIKQVLEDLRLCKLNEKHLKPMRIKKKK